MSIFGIPIFPEQASTFAKDVDALYFFILATCAFFAIGVSVAVVWLGIKYHKTHDGQIGARIEGNLPLELLWSVIPTIIAMFMFGWGASVFFHLRRPPEEALHLYAVGKQWMWKFQHLEGQREINELHIPAGRPVKITISSEDVLHSLYFPVFRVKADAIPGRYSEIWFEATQTGDFHMFCAEYCGTSHSDMITQLVVHEPGGYEAFLQKAEDLKKKLPPAELGKMLYSQQGCETCHSTDGSTKVGPTWKGMYGHEVKFADGTSGTVDENYLRESINQPQAKIVAGFAPSMPTYQGKLADYEINGLIEFIKSLK
jgi:cytochrome c oxidase subunit 2